MTQNEFLAKYGQQKVRFYSYYKYQFTFCNELVGVTFGGDSTDIYRFMVDTDLHTIQRLNNQAWMRYAEVPADGVSENWDA